MDYYGDLPVYVPAFRNWYMDGMIEEGQMIELHGSAYFNYRERTGMFIPKI
ncbi:MAG: hypothetical protein KAU52_01170 [Methanosarcinales archaeon]|nr:hypothetical protein [Methanosarcinales archaeon]